MSNLLRSGVNHVARKRRIPNALSLFNKMFIPPEDRESLRFLLHARSKRFFFAIVDILHPEGSSGYELIAKAHKTLLHEFRGYRRQSGEPEAEHSVRAAMVAMIVGNVRNANKIAGILLHDMIEKFRDKWSVERISREFNPEVGYLAGGLTRPVQSGDLIKDADHEEASRMQLIEGGKDFLELKVYDWFDNLLTLWNRGDDRMERKVVEMEVMLPYLRKHKIRFARYIERVLVYILTRINRPRALNFERTA